MSGVHAAPALMVIVTAMGLGWAAPAMAQDHHGHSGHAGQPEQTGAAEHSKMDHSKMDHSKMDHSKMDHSKMDHSGMGHASMEHPVTPVPALTDADRAAAFPMLTRPMQHASTINSYLLFDRLEAWDDDAGTGQAWEAKGWIGTDTDRLWLRSEGERVGGETHAADLEVLYGRSVSAWWDVVAGVRHDFAPGDARTWAAFGVQGLAPYLFELEVTGYLAESGHSALAVEAEYELLLSNRLILQPVVEATLHGKEDAARGVGQGLSSVEAGLRLRYELNRHFAPYVGVVHERTFGDTAALRRVGGDPARDTRVVAGVRIWF